MGVAFTLAFSAYSLEDANALLKRAKAEAKYLYTNSVQPKKNSDDDKYVCITYASGKKFVDRKKIALDLFERAANAGSGEAAYILFCYKWLGRYKEHVCFIWDWDKFGEEALNNCYSDLQKAVDLHSSEALEFAILKNEISDESIVTIFEHFNLLYDALNGDPISQMDEAMRYRHSNTTKYEYWMKKSISNKNWPLLARTDYALYLLDSNRRDEAMSIIAPAEKRTDYRNDKTASFGINKLFLFYVADHLYRGDTEGAMNACDNLYKEGGSYLSYSYGEGVFDKFKAARDYNYLEGCVNYFSNKDQQHLLETIYSLNKNPGDKTILHDRGEKFEQFGDSLQAFNYYKAAAFKHHKRSIYKVFDYATKGFNLSDSEITDVLSYIIISEDKEKDAFTISGEFTDWRIYFILAEYFYKSNHRDYKKAAALYFQCTRNSSGSPNIIKGESARQLFKCHEFGRGVPADHDKALEWIEYAKRTGDYDAVKIYKALYDL